MYLWRAVDEEGEVLDMIVQPRRGTENLETWWNESRHHSSLHCTMSCKPSETLRGLCPPPGEPRLGFYISVPNVVFGRIVAAAVSSLSTWGYQVSAPRPRRRVVNPARHSPPAVWSPIDNAPIVVPGAQSVMSLMG